MRLFIEILVFCFLFAPYLFEVWNDREGDLNKVLDVFVRIAISVIVCVINYLATSHPFFASGLMCFAIFFLLFDYTINAILIRNKVIDSNDFFSYMGKKGDVDNIKFWRNMHPGWRFAIRMGVMAIAIVIYF